MKVINLGEKNSILNKFVAQMRDRKSEGQHAFQKKPGKARRNIRL